MSESCFKCKKVIVAEEQKLNCSNDECFNKSHRSCVDIDEAVFEAISKHPLIKFNCGECVNHFKALHNKVQTLEEKMNRLCAGMSQLQTRLFQQSIQLNSFGSNNNNNSNTAEGKKFAHHHNNNNSLMVVGSNVTTTRLKVVCDFGRWVQVGKFATSTTEEDIIDFLADALQLTKNKVKCTKLVKNDANLAQLSYCKFKISIPDHRFNDLFNESIWPSGVMVSPFTPRSQINFNRI